MLVFPIGLAILFLDQLTKQAIRRYLIYGETRPIIDGFFNLVYVRNDGAAWNIFSGYGIVLILISLFVLIMLLTVWRKHFPPDWFSQNILLGLMIGGIAGNLVDRIRFGWVTDFLDFQFGRFHYPSFNVADSAMCIAISLYLIIGVVRKNKVKKQ